MHKFFLFTFFLFCIGLQAQEFNAVVSVNADQTTNPNLQVYRTLEKSVTEFINNTKWTDVAYRTEERINCNFLITVGDNNNDSFSASLQIQASRPIFGSNYETTILKANDEQFNFNYLEFQSLNYNNNSFESNLISVIAFYLYTILGIDADTYELNSGTPYYEEAKAIVGNAQSSNTLGWNIQDGPQTRFRLNDDLLSATFEKYRSAMYTYHREGLDVMNSDVKQGKETILASMKVLEEMHRTRPNSFLMRVFFNAKAEEMSQILSGGPSVNAAETIAILTRIAPAYGVNWSEIKF